MISHGERGANGSTGRNSRPGSRHDPHNARFNRIPARFAHPQGLPRLAALYYIPLAESLLHYNGNSPPDPGRALRTTKGYIRIFS